MTRYEYAMQQAGDTATENYLRDLKASHDILLKSFKSRVDYCEDDRCRACEREQEIIKAAEALR